MTQDLPRLIDTHCHLAFPDYAEDLPQVLARAEAAGIDRMIAIATRLDERQALTALAEAHAPIYCTVGSHPHEAERDSAIEVETLLAQAQHPKVVGIGESGLDFYRNHADAKAQERNFRTHIAAARETNLPLVIHARSCDKEMIEIIHNESKKGRFRALLHCFTAGRALAEAALELGFYISLSGIITFRNARDLCALAADLPLTRLLVETDAPYLAPEPHRGKRNEPSYMVRTAERLAELQGVSFERLAQQTTENAQRLFFDGA